jgi:hypothetical protein
LVKIKRKDSLIVEFLIRKSKKLEKIGTRLLNKTKGIIKKGDRAIKILSFLKKEIIKPKKLIPKII